jgi:hypothetical protein
MKLKNILLISLILNFCFLGYILGNKYYDYRADHQLSHDLRAHFAATKAKYRDLNIEAWHSVIESLKAKNFDAKVFQKTLDQLHYIQAQRIETFTDYLCSKAKSMTYEERLKFAKDLKFMRTRFHRHHRIKGE